jgi:hypothetical protein
MEACICGENEKTPGLVSPAHNILANHGLQKFIKMLGLIILTDLDPNGYASRRADLCPIKALNPGSKGRKRTGSRIRIRNTA